MLCPRCDQQGRVALVRITTNDETVYLCDECDALWPENTPIKATNFIDFSSYVKPLGLKGLWSEVTILEADA